MRLIDGEGDESSEAHGAENGGGYRQLILRHYGTYGLTWENILGFNLNDGGVSSF